MEVRIGVTYAARELDIELADDTDREELARQVAEAIGTERGVLWLTDAKGRKYGVPSERIAYVEIGSPEAERRIGFGH